MMKRFCFMVPAIALLMLTACIRPVDGPDVNAAWMQQASTEKLADITYQINVYSFADSDGDGWGDIRGITRHLDYIESLGATGLWLSPIHEAGSYHGYDVIDYNSVSNKLGTETDLRELIDKAKAKNISIYLDFVLNHSGKLNNWFQDASSNPSSPFRDYYVISSNPEADVAARKVDNFAGAYSPGMGSWHIMNQDGLGYKGRLHFLLDWNNKTVTVTETTEAAQPSNPSATRWIYYGSGVLAGLYETGTGIYEITVDFDSDWGFLIRTSTSQWDGGHKWGGQQGQGVTFGSPYKINNSTAADIVFSSESLWYFASFDSSMPDLNYGPYAKASESPAFKALGEAASKWIDMGIAGLRLDAVAWIYQNQTAANVSFLKQWYDYCNTAWKAAGGSGDFYMVGEAWVDTAEKMAPYYGGLPSNFNFYYWYTLKDRINRGKGDDFVQTAIYFQNLFRRYRPDFIDAIKLSNHDEDRAANDLGRIKEKEKLAAAVLLTSAGKPFIYQGEELGYWGSKSQGDEYVRAPIKWTVDGSVPTNALNGKADFGMLTGSISVEYQENDSDSVLNVYRAFAKARNAWKALAKGSASAVSSPSSSVALWTRTCEEQVVLVAHNFGTSEQSVPLADYTLDKCIVSNGSVTVSDGTLILGPRASAVYLQ